MIRFLKALYDNWWILTIRLHGVLFLSSRQVNHIEIQHPLLRITLFSTLLYSTFILYLCLIRQEHTLHPQCPKKGTQMCMSEWSHGLTLIQNVDWGFLLSTTFPTSEIITQPHYTHLFGPLREHLRGQKFADDIEVMEAVQSWLNATPKSFFIEGIRKLLDRWNKCIAKHGDYVEKQETNYFYKYSCTKKL